MRCSTQQVQISKLWREKNLYDLDPPYQREAGIWSNSKKSKLIDSIFNNFDLPKFYIHDISDKEDPFSFNVIDGKQRLSAIWDFRAGNFELSSDFQYSGDMSTPPKPGDRFGDLAEEAKEVFGEYAVDLVLVTKADQEDIEELFSRLNAGESLNAAEQRRALGGDMRDTIIQIAKEKFFHTKLGFKLRRYSHEEVAAKFLKIEQNLSVGGGEYCDLKKKHLDEMVVQNHIMKQNEKKKLVSNVNGGIGILDKVFQSNDPHLGKQSYPQLYYFFCKKVFADYSHPHLPKITRDFLDAFKLEREQNLLKDEDDRDPNLIEYGRLAQQGTNDLNSMSWRVDQLLKRFLLWNSSVVIKDKKRLFSEAERHTIWIKANQKCESCGKSIKLDEMDADHVHRWESGGKTILENAKAACVNCNRRPKP